MIKAFFRNNRFTKNYYEKLRKKRKRFWIQKNGIKELSLVTQLLNKKGVVAFADFGTLLGIIREGRLLKHDLDIDVGVVGSSKELSTIIESAFNSIKYTKSREFIVDKRIAEQSYEKNRIKIDIQYYYNDSADSMFCYLFYNKNIIKEGYWQTVKKKCARVENLKKKSVNGYTVFVPSNAESLLESKYGPNWRTPDKGWCYWEGPNTEKVNSLGKLYSTK